MFDFASSSPFAFAAPQVAPPPPPSLQQSGDNANSSHSSRSSHGSGDGGGNVEYADADMMDVDDDVATDVDVDSDADGVKHPRRATTGAADSTTPHAGPKLLPAHSPLVSTRRVASSLVPASTASASSAGLHADTGRSFHALQAPKAQPGDQGGEQGKVGEKQGEKESSDAPHADRGVRTRTKSKTRANTATGTGAKAKTKTPATQVNARDGGDRTTACSSVLNTLTFGCVDLSGVESVVRTLKGLGGDVTLALTGLPKPAQVSVGCVCVCVCVSVVFACLSVVCVPAYVCVCAVCAVCFFACGCVGMHGVRVYCRCLCACLLLCVSVVVASRCMHH